MKLRRTTSLFLERVRDAIRTKHYSIRTERAYLDWTRRFILFHGKRHPRQMGDTEIGEFLTYLAVQRNVAASTQNQALNALVFLYRNVLGQPLGENINGVRVKKPRKLPVVLSRQEIRSLLRNVDGNYWLPACLLYGSGLRLMECMRLRVQDLEFSRRAILVRNGKGGKDRVVTLPDSLMEPLQQHLAGARVLHNKDLQDGFGEVFLMHWRVSTRTLPASGDGSTCLQRGGNAVVSPFGDVLDPTVE
jgi:integron integrase